jgi:two-component system chemotaxis sensor kinase CheA
MDEQLLKEFLDGSEELFESLSGDIGALRVQHGDGRARRELVGRIFRHVHTMKGTASAAGLETTAEAAHEFESALDAVRMGRVALDPAALDLFDDTVQAIAENLSAVAAHARQQNGAPPALPNVVPPILLRRLRHLASSEAVQTSTPAQAKQAAALSAALPEEIRHSLSEYELQRLSETTGEGAGVCVVEVSFGLDTFDEQFRRLSDMMAETGEIISTLPGIEPHAPERVHFRILYATPEQSAPQVAARIAHFGASLVVCGAKPSETTGDESKGEGISAASPVTSAQVAVTSLTDLVRVPLDELDGIIASARELLNETNAALDLALASDATHDARREIEERAAGIRRRFAELEDRLLELRTVSVGPTLERAARAGAAAARGLGIDVEFETSGGEVRLDKSLADALAEPLLHLVRNAVAHGIETPAERLAAGKAARGRVRLEASCEASYHKGGIVLRVADDGRGIVAAHVTRAAVECGIVERGAQLTEEQALRVIFRTGFTTTREVSTFAGRGIGLEIVERAIESAGGELRVRTHAGAGTTFEMRLPATRK